MTDSKMDVTIPDDPLKENALVSLAIRPLDLIASVTPESKLIPKNRSVNSAKFGKRCGIMSHNTYTS